MKSTTRSQNDNKILVDIVDLQAMLSLGYSACASIGESANAVVKFGRRKMYNVEKIRRYIDSISE